MNIGQIRYLKLVINNNKKNNKKDAFVKNQTV